VVVRPHFKEVYSGSELGYPARDRDSRKRKRVEQILSSQLKTTELA
jgi:hypothetical protein